MNIVSDEDRSHGGTSDVVDKKRFILARPGRPRLIVRRPSFETIVAPTTIWRIPLAESRSIGDRRKVVIAYAINRSAHKHGPCSVAETVYLSR